ncbi:MAG: tetratricopeptide repeat protein [Proteobacteria bacterium]|nr:tetratricopeptide repeat protein [Pseudomonadota bacterium]MBU1710135.1 tetratricopeptide repeat protein [Pseudomonadota bacterium]
MNKHDSRNRNHSAGYPESTADLQSLFTEALSQHQAGNYPEAEQLYNRVLAQIPENINLLCNLGALYREMKDPASAVTCLQQARAIDPENPIVNLNLGATLEEYNDMQGALNCYRKALRTDPNDPRILNNLGKALYLQGKTEEALNYLNRAVMIAPDYPLAQNNLGVLLCALGRTSEAIDCFKQSLATNPQDSATLYNLAGALNTAGNETEAESFYQQALAADQHNAAARHMLAAISGTPTHKAPADYVVDTFDRYAAHFDYQLTEKLGYQVPGILKDALIQTIGDTRFAHGLDLGCGTGLSGLAFRGLTKTLSGVDLSERMLEKAESKNIYDKLYKDDLISFLEKTEDKFDLFIATDVFIYIGDLLRIFKTIRERAASSAYLAFSIETAGEVRDYELRSSGRYAQSADYIHRLAAECGFTVAADQEQNIRKEQGQWINGRIFILKIA